MKVIIYNGQKKFTVDNISIPNARTAADLLRHQRDEFTVSEDDLQRYNFRITSTRSIAYEDEDFVINEDLEREIEEGIHWKLESVN
jgi:hypothetical protein